MAQGCQVKNHSRGPSRGLWGMPESRVICREDICPPERRLVASQLVGQTKKWRMPSSEFTVDTSGTLAFPPAGEATPLSSTMTR